MPDYRNQFGDELPIFSKIDSQLTELMTRRCCGGETGSVHISTHHSSRVATMRQSQLEGIVREHASYEFSKEMFGLVEWNVFIDRIRGYPCHGIMLPIYSQSDTRF